MTMKSPIPLGHERAVTRPESIATPQQEIGRLFDGLTRNFLQFPCLQPCAQHGP
jgi:hypothetical protein